MEKNPRINRLLIVVLDNLGDTVMATSLLNPLRQIYPSAFIGLWVKKYASGLFDDQSLVDEIHASDPFWDKSPGFPRGTRAEFYKILREIRHRNYDVAFILNTEWRRSLACFLARIPHRVGYRRRKSGFFLTHSLKPEQKVQHFVDDHRKLLEFWCGQSLAPNNCVPRLDLSDQEKRWAESLINQKGWENHPIISLHPFAGDQKKCWPLENWGELMKGLWRKNSKIRFALICSPTELRDLSQELQMLPSEKFQVVTSLSQVKALVGNSVLMVGGGFRPGPFGFFSRYPRGDVIFCYQSEAVRSSEPFRGDSYSKKKPF